MDLKSLFRTLPKIGEKIPDADILRVTDNPGQADASSLFVCIRGFRADGHDFALDAYRRGCRYFLAERPLPLPEDAFVFLTSDTRNALGKIACAMCGDPSRKMHLIGVTGTKGKTTTACMIAHILNESGIPCGYIGTNGIAYGSRRFSTTNTTPDAITLQKTLAQMAEEGCRAVVLEVSSQALKLDRVAGTSFDICLFTNFSSDHIGPEEHANMEEYAACKHRLFTDFGAKTVIYNADDPNADRMIAGTSAGTCIPCSPSGIFPDALFSAERKDGMHDVNTLGTEFVLRAGSRTDFRNIFCSLPMVGRGNICNAILAIACAECFGIAPERSARALATISVAGRSQIIPLPGGVNAVIDYAHNGAGLRQLLTDLRGYHPHRLICLFGSVGERTKLRRRELGEVAAELADLCILTSDNPGKEPPQEIINEIALAFRNSSTPYLAIPDRTEAIRTAVRTAERGDILVLAGKGHETYQLIGTERIPFCEAEILKQAAGEFAEK